MLQLTLACGEKRTEVFVHSLELGHTAGTRAIKAMGERDAHTHTHTFPSNHATINKSLHIFLAVKCIISYNEVETELNLW